MATKLNIKGHEEVKKFLSLSKLLLNQDLPKPPLLIKSLNQQLSSTELLKIVIYIYSTASSQLYPSFPSKPVNFQSKFTPKKFISTLDKPILNLS